MNYHRTELSLSLCACLFVTSALSADDNPLARTREKLAAHQPVKIVCLGDSVTGIYYHTGGRRAYPEMIEIGLKRIDPACKVTVINAGISGNSTADGLKRLQKDVLDHRPDLVTVMFGLNDMVRVPVADFQANLRTIISNCREIDAEVLLCTPNGVIDTSSRPRVKLEQYNVAMKDVGESEGVPVCDVYAVYEKLRTADMLAFRLLCSDEIHPNMDGHKLNAETICETIAGKNVSLADVGPPSPPLAHVRKRIESGEVVRIHAMTPVDKWIGPALQMAFPNAKVEVTRWKTEGQTLNQLHETAKSVRQLNPKPDLVVVAIPLEITPTLSKPAEAFIADYIWTINHALSFGVQDWDVIGIAPSVLHAKLSDADQDREKFACKMVAAQHLDLILRMPDNKDDPQTILKKWIAR